MSNSPSRPYFSINKHTVRTSNNCTDAVENTTGLYMHACRHVHMLFVWKCCTCLCTLGVTRRLPEQTIINKPSWQPPLANPQPKSIVFTCTMSTKNQASSKETDHQCKIKKQQKYQRVTWQTKVQSRTLRSLAWLALPHDTSHGGLALFGFVRIEADQNWSNVGDQEAQWGRKVPSWALNSVQNPGVTAPLSDNGTRSRDCWASALFIVWKDHHACPCQRHQERLHSLWRRHYPSRRNLS